MLMKHRLARAIIFIQIVQDCLPLVIHSPARSYVIEQLLARLKDRSLRVLPLGELEEEAKALLQLQAQVSPLAGAV